MNLKGSQTEKNLIKTFIGESQARNRYNFAGDIARDEGFQQIGAIFDETAHNEHEHARVTYRFLGGMGTTAENLRNAINGETEESRRIYREFEAMARKEGFSEIADFYKELAETEEHHQKRFQALLNNVENNKVFQKDQVVRWKCRNCGYIHEGKEAPAKCPLCGYPRSYFELLCEKY